MPTDATTVGTGRLGGRSTNVDVLRAVAALYVLVVHASALQGHLFGFFDGDPWHLFIDTGAAGVWLFFALSGNLIAGPFIAAAVQGTALPAVWPYALRRAARIWPGYVLALSAQILLVVGAHSVRLREYPVHYLLLQNLVPGQFEAILSVAWTLSVEAIFYVLVPVVFCAFRRLAGPGPVRRRTVALAIGAVWLASIAFTILADLHRADTTGLYLRELFPALLGSFCPGMLVAVAVNASPGVGQPGRSLDPVVRHRAVLVAAALALAVLAAVMTTDSNLVVYDGSRTLFAGAAGIAVLLAVTGRPFVGPMWRGVAWLGTISYGIYLWQAVMGGLVLRHHAVPLPRAGLGPYLVHLAYLFVLTVPIAAASWYLVERPAMSAVRARTRPALADQVKRPWNRLGRVGRT